MRPGRRSVKTRTSEAARRATRARVLAAGPMPADADAGRRYAAGRTAKICVRSGARVALRRLDVGGFRHRRVRSLRREVGVTFQQFNLPGRLLVLYVRFDGRCRQ
jgi:hypothetical protein